MLSRFKVFHAMSRQVEVVLPGVRRTQVRGLVLLVLGVVWAKQVTLARMAAALPVAAHPSSTERRLRRWLANGRVDIEAMWRPLRRVMLAQYRGQEITLVFDPTPFGDRATLLCIGIVHGRRVVLLDVQVMPQQTPWGVSLPAILGPMFAALAADLPTESTVTLLADRQFVGPGLGDCCIAVGWHMVQRLRSNPHDSTRIMLPDGQVLPVPHMITGPGQSWSSAVKIFKDAGWRDGYLTIVWPRGYDEPLVLFSSRPGGRQRVREYGRRTRIEASYQDLKSRGFHLEQRRLRDPERLRRLLLMVFLAYWWLIQLGDRAVKQAFRPRWERPDRRELSRLNLGYRFLDLYTDAHPIPPLLLPRTFRIPANATG